MIIRDIRKLFELECNTIKFTLLKNMQATMCRVDLHKEKQQDGKVGEILYPLPVFKNLTNYNINSFYIICIIGNYS